MLVQLSTIRLCNERLIIRFGKSLVTAKRWRFDGGMDVRVRGIGWVRRRGVMVVRRARLIQTPMIQRSKPSLKLRRRYAYKLSFQFVQKKHKKTKKQPISPFRPRSTKLPLKDSRSMLFPFLFVQFVCSEFFAVLVNRSPKLKRKGHLCGCFSSLLTCATTNKVTSCDKLRHADADALDGRPRSLTMCAYFEGNQSTDRREKTVRV